MDRLTIQFDGDWVPKEMCSVDRYGEADDCDVCSDYCEFRCENCPVQKCFNQLAAYEDTGLTSEEITDGKLLTGWIPVSKRLPEDDQMVFTCDNYDNIHIMHHHKDFEDPFGIGCNHPRLNKVVAWMPLPEPYKGDLNE